LFLKKENKLIQDVFEPIFKTSIFDSGKLTLTQSEWIGELLKNTGDENVTHLFPQYEGISDNFRIIKSSLTSLHNTREEALQKFSTLTTTRLKLIRESECNASLRKKNVDRDMVIKLITTNQRVVSSLTDDLIKLSIGGKDLSKEYLNKHRVGIVTSTRQEIAKEVYDAIECSLPTQLSKQFQDCVNSVNQKSIPEATIALVDSSKPVSQKDHPDSVVRILDKKVVGSTTFTVNSIKDKNETLRIINEKNSSTNKRLTTFAWRAFCASVHVGFVKNPSAICSHIFANLPLVKHMNKSKAKDSEIASLVYSIWNADPDDDVDGCNFSRA
jgi:hypothetical protein